MKIKMSKDAILLLVMFIVFVVISYIIAMNQDKPDSSSSYSTGKNGMKAIYLLLSEKLKLDVSRHHKLFAELPDDARVMFIVNPIITEESEKKALINWVEKGNTLIFAVSTDRLPLYGLQINLKPNPNVGSISIPPKTGRYSKGVNLLNLRAPVCIDDVDTTPIVKDEHGNILIGESRWGKGRIIIVCDPMLLANGGIGIEDNVVLATNFVYENIGKGGRILFSEYNPMLASKQKGAPILSKAGKLVIGQLAFVLLLVLISAGWRFGTVHPLPEQTERRRGWELVKAMAGLYKKAEARHVAVTAVYQSFRRELFMKFGVDPAARPNEAADSILRAKQVDKARLISLLSRCDQIQNGERPSDSDAIMLTRSIEEFRRELGIARSTDN